MKRKLGRDQIGNDSVFSNYKLHFVTGALERRYQQGGHNLLTCATIWNYVHFNIDAYFNHSVLSRIFMLGFDLFCVRVVCSLVPKWLVNTFGCLQGWSWWFCTMVAERSMKAMQPCSSLTPGTPFAPIYFFTYLCKVSVFLYSPFATAFLWWKNRVGKNLFHNTC